MLEILLTLWGSFQSQQVLTHSSTLPSKMNTHFINVKLLTNDTKLTQMTRLRKISSIEPSITDIIMTFPWSWPCNIMFIVDWSVLHLSPSDIILTWLLTSMFSNFTRVLLRSLSLISSIKLNILNKYENTNLGIKLQDNSSIFQVANVL